MSRPLFYYGNLCASGTLTGSNTDPRFPVARVADSFLGLRYPIASGSALTNPSGQVQVALDFDTRPDVFFAVAPLDFDSGATYSVVVESDNLLGSAPLPLVTGALSANAPLLLTIPSGAVDRPVWRVLVSGAGANVAVPSWGEAGFATLYQPPRDHEVGVRRGRERQFARVPVPGSQPFTLRQGPVLRLTSYTYRMVSTSELDELEAFLTAIDGGQPFVHQDDQGEVYFAEMPDSVLAVDDEAGVLTVTLTVREVRVF